MKKEKLFKVYGRAVDGVIHPFLSLEASRITDVNENNLRLTLITYFEKRFAVSLTGQMNLYAPLSDHYFYMPISFFKMNLLCAAGMKEAMIYFRASKRKDVGTSGSKFLITNIHLRYRLKEGGSNSFPLGNQTLVLQVIGSSLELKEK